MAAKEKEKWLSNLTEALQERAHNLKPSGVQRYQKNSKENSNTNFSTEGSLYWTLNRRFYYILNYLW